MMAKIGAETVNPPSIEDVVVRLRNIVLLHLETSETTLERVKGSFGGFTKNDIAAELGVDLAKQFQNWFNDTKNLVTTYSDLMDLPDL